MFCRQSRFLNPTLHCLGLFTTGSNIRGHANVKGEAMWSVEALFWSYTVLESGEKEMFALWLRWASHREQHGLVSDWKLLVQCMCTHVVPVSIQSHWSTCPMGKAEGTETITVEKGSFWEEVIAVCQYNGYHKERENEALYWDAQEKTERKWQWIDTVLIIFR